MTEIERAVAAVKQLAAMSPKMKSRFFHQARLMFLSFDVTIASMRTEGKDPTPLISMRKWLYRQPFDVDPTLPIPTGEAARTMSAAETFERILPHVKTHSVDSILEQLPGRWRKGTLRKLLRGMRPGLPTILATCRAHGQDEEPWHILMAWEANLPAPRARTSKPWTFGRSSFVVMNRGTTTTTTTSCCPEAPPTAGVTAEHPAPAGAQAVPQQRAVCVRRDVHGAEQRARQPEDLLEAVRRMTARPGTPERLTSLAFHRQLRPRHVGFGDDEHVPRATEEGRSVVLGHEHRAARHVEVEARGGWRPLEPEERPDAHAWLHSEGLAPWCTADRSGGGSFWGTAMGTGAAFGRKSTKSR